MKDTQESVSEYPAATADKENFIEKLLILLCSGAFLPLGIVDN